MTTYSLNNKKIVIVGQGAMGLLFYHHLQQVNKQVSLLGSKLSSKLSTGYLYTAYHAAEAKPHPLLYAQADNIKQAEVIILSVKSYQVVTALKSIAQLIKHSCLVVLAHNGMGTLIETQKLLPPNQRILAMLTTHASLRTAPLTITHTGLGHTSLGLLAGSMTKIEINELTLLLNQAMPTFTFESNIKNKQWLKLAVNCVINPITALNNIENGQVNLEKFTEIKTALIAEIVAIAKAENVILTNQELTEVIQKVAQSTEKNSSSMRCDILAKRQTEIAYINGYIHGLGIKHNIATPNNTQVWQAVRTVEASY